MKYMNDIICKNFIHKYNCDIYVENPDFCNKCGRRVPEDYLYDCETSDFIVYRNKYTGKEIHVLKEKTIKIPRRTTKGEWVKSIHDKFICNTCGYEPRRSDQDVLSNFCANCGVEMTKTNKWLAKYPCRRGAIL